MLDAMCTQVQQYPYNHMQIVLHFWLCLDNLGRVVLSYIEEHHTVGMSFRLLL